MQQEISLVVAMTKNNIIGVKNKLPWFVPEELKFFKELTIGHVIIMGRKTYNSIGKPLPLRENIIITRDKNYQQNDIHVTHNINDAIALAKTFNKKIFIIGGGEIYQQTLLLANKLYITIVNVNIDDGDTFFPEIDINTWMINEQRNVIAKCGTLLTYIIYSRGDKIA